VSRGKIVAGICGVVLIVGLAACGGNQPTLESPSSGTASSTATPSIDPAAQPAVDAYLKFAETSSQAMMHPTVGELPPEADFTRWSFDPMRAKGEQLIHNLVTSNQAFKGDPGTPRVQVVSVDLDATPYPTVILDNCAKVSSDWRAYDVRNGEVLPTATDGASPPHLYTITMIEYRKHWGVQNIAVDESKTCTR
jgi:hypothetical protein